MMMSENGPLISLIKASRTPLMELVTHAVDDLASQGNEQPRIITFWGNKGIGKTTLLDYIVSQLRSRPAVRLIEVKNLTALSLEDLEANLNRVLSGRSPEEMVILFLDNLDDLLRKEEKGQAFFDFEINVILPLIERGNSLVVASSLIELNQWREDEVRTRQVNRAIPTLTHDEIAFLANQIGVNADKVYEYTFGQPRAIYWLLEQPTITPKEIADKAWDYFLEDISEEGRQIAVTISCLPVFNPFLLRKIIERNQHRDDAQYLVYLEHIREYMAEAWYFGMSRSDLIASPTAPSDDCWRVMFCSMTKKNTWKFSRLPPNISWMKPEARHNISYPAQCFFLNLLAGLASHRLS